MGSEYTFIPAVVPQMFGWTALSLAALVSLEPIGDVVNAPFAISQNGNIVVGERNSAAGSEAYRWTRAGGMLGLGDLPGGSFASGAFDVSADGSVVVGYGWVNFVGSTEAFIWDTTNGMQNLKDVLVNDHGLNVSGWTLTEALAISPDGLTIVRHGYNPGGYTEAWVATIPEPATLLLLGFGGMGLLRKRCNKERK